jgi:5'-3' exonuclease
VCSIDKDLDVLPGRHFNFVKGEEYLVPPGLGSLKLSDDRKKVIGRGLIWFYAQMLLGDSADNIQGLSGHGPVLVNKLLSCCKTEEEAFKVVRTQYEKEYPTWIAKERILENAKLLWIQQYTCTDKTKHIERFYEAPIM